MNLNGTHKASGGGQSRRMMTYCYDSMGVGHIRRSLTICDHLTQSFEHSSFLIATGTPYVPLLQPSRGVDYVKLPSIMKRPNSGYGCKYLSLDNRQMFKCRKALLLTTVQYYRPSILLVDRAPSGVYGELVPVLRWLRRNCPETAVVFGMRDIEDAPEHTIQKWSSDGVIDALEEYFDEIWVYGSRDVYDVAEEYKLPHSLREKMIFTGYLERAECGHVASKSGKHPEVLVTVGGGTDGARLLRMYLGAAAQGVASMGGSSTIVGGPDLPGPAAARLRTMSLSLPATRWIDEARCMSCLMRSADLVVSMGGYNTMCEIASFGKSALIVPRTKPRYEQAIRAALWDQLGVVTATHPNTLSPEKLSDRVVRLLDGDRSPDRTGLDMQGLDRIAERCSALWYGAGCESVVHM